MDLSPDCADPLADLQSNGEIPWLEPLFDARWNAVPSRPEASAIELETLRLAFVAGLQRLTPGQRAVILLRDVRGFCVSGTA